jgi:hypothetical protein
MAYSISERRRSMKTPILATGWEEGKDIHTVVKHFGNRVSHLGTTNHPSHFDLMDCTDEDIQKLKKIGVTATIIKGS